MIRVATLIDVAAQRTREEKKAETRKRLLAAAERVFAEKGYLGAAVDDVAAAAGLTKGGVYAHFRSKEDLYMALARTRGYRSLREVEGLLAEDNDSEARAKALSDRLIKQISSRTELARFVFGEEFLIHASRNSRLRRQVRDLSAQALEVDAELIAKKWAELGIEPAIHAEDLSRMINGLARQLAWEAVLDPKADLAPVAERAISFLIRAARGSQARH